MPAWLSLKVTVSTVCVPTPNDPRPPAFPLVAVFVITTQSNSMSDTP